MASIQRKISFQNNEIYIGWGFLNIVAMDIIKPIKESKELTTVCIISDGTVSNLYGEKLKSAFQSLQMSSSLIVQLEHDFEKISFSGYLYIVLLGSSTIRRWSDIATKDKKCIGIAIIPTTLRGFIGDINIERMEDGNESQNRPTKSVLIDVSVLRTLPRRHFLSGMSEIIKIAAVSSKGWRKWIENLANNFSQIYLFDENELLLDYVESNADLLISASDDVMVQAVTRTLNIKLQILDFAIQNNNPEILSSLKLGKCIGEAISDIICPELLYGECMAVGMVKEAEMYGENICSSFTKGRLIRCLKRFALPTRIPSGLRTMDIVAKLKSFPKNVSLDTIQFVLEKQIHIVPRTKVSGSVRVPGSKSISNRVLLMAAMGRGTCHLSGILHSDDTQVMMNALERIGTKFRWIDNDQVLVVEGTGGKFRLANSEQEIDINNSGTSARFLTTLLTLVKNETNAPIILTGSSRMKERPIGSLVHALQLNGCSITYLENEECLPLAIKHSGLKGGLLHISSKLSSTFVTSVLISAPYASEPMTIELDQEIPTSLPYILMTVQLMAKFNIHVEKIGQDRYIVACGVYENPSHLEIEVDASSATYSLGMAAVTGGTVSVHGLGKDSLQGDAKFCSLLERMGCEVVQNDGFTSVTGPFNGALQCISINMESMTDAFMTAAVLCAVACGITQLRGISNQRVKESNRIEVMVKELKRVGISCGELADGMWVEGIGDWSSEKRKKILKKAYIRCHNDHRIAMSFAVLGCVLEQIIITDKECTEKTYPSFWEDCRNKLGLTIHPHFVPQIDNINNNLAPCVVVIGMRGCGKSVLGFQASKTFNLKFIDSDIMLEEQFREPLSTYVLKNSWEQFRHEESQLLGKIIENESNNSIICCGGGVVESESARTLLKNYAHVVYIQCDIDTIMSNLSRDTNPRRVDLLEPIENVYQRRVPWFENCSKYKFVIKSTDSLNQTQKDFEMFLQAKIPNLLRK